MKIYNVKINLDKINKDKVFQGEKGKWYEVSVVVSDQPDQYGNIATIQERQSKEDRESGKPRNYLGNGTLGYDSENAVSREQEAKDDLPW